MLKVLGAQIKEFKKDSILTPLCMILEVIMEMLVPLLMASIIDNGVNAGNMGHILKVGGLMIVIAIIGLLAGLGGAKYGARASTGFARNLRKQIYDHIQTLSFENLDKYQTSSLVTRLTTDVTSCQDAFITMIRMLFRSPVMFLVSFIMCTTIKIELTAVLLVAFPILVVALLIIMTKAHPYFEKMFKRIV